MADAFDAVFDDPGQLRMDLDNSPYVSGQRDVLPGIINQHPSLDSLKRDRRILDITDSLLPGEHDFLPGDGSRFRSETTWHTDAVTNPRAYPHQRHLKMALYLDPLDGTSGALRVIPGSHHYIA